MNQKIISSVLWLSFLLAMAASIGHLAWTFGTVERAGWEWLGWIPAVAVDAGLAAMAYTIQQRKRSKRPTTTLWAGVVGFALISALANLYYGLSVEATVTPELSPVISAVWLQAAKVLVLSATLPIMYIFLGEIVSGDDATVAERLARQSEREQRRADLEAERSANEAKRLLLEAENERAKTAQSEPAPANAFIHEPCQRTFSSRNALNAHIARCPAIRGDAAE